MKKVKFINSTQKVWSGLNEYRHPLIVSNDASIDDIETMKVKGQVVGEVTSIGLVHQHLMDESEISKELISQERQEAILYNIVKGMGLDSLKLSDNNIGLISEISDVIDEFIEAGADVEGVLDLSKILRGSLGSKVNEVASIFKEYIKYLEENNLVNSSILSNQVNKHIKEKGLNKYDVVVIARLNNYSSKNIEFIKALEGANCDIIVVSDNIHKKTFDDLYAFFNQSDKVEIIDSISDKKSKVKSIDVCKYETIFQEVDNITDKINNLINQGEDYDDILIVSGNTHGYYNLFKQNGLPVYMNRRTSLMFSKIFKQIKSTYEILLNSTITEKNFVDFLESRNESARVVKDYINKFGATVSGLKNCKRFDLDMHDQILMHDGYIREMVNILIDKNNISKNYALNLYDYLVDSGYTQVIVDDLNSLNETKSKELRQTWSDFVSILRDLGNIEFNEPKDFWLIFEKIAKDKKVKVERHFNQIEIVNFNEAYDKNVKYIFFVGANEGTTPNLNTNGLLSITDRLNIWRSSDYKLEFPQDVLEREVNNITSVIYKDGISIELSYPVSDELGGLLNRASALKDIFDKNDVMEVAYSSHKEIEKVLGLISNMETESDFDKIEEEYIKAYNGPNRARLSNAINFLTKDMGRINSLNPGRIFGGLKSFSISRVQSFFRDPFTHYIERGLRPYAKEVLEENPMHKGDFYHQVIESYFNKYIIGVEIKDIEDDEDVVNLRVKEIVNELKFEHNNGALTSSGKLGFELILITRTLEVALLNIVRQIKWGEFKPLRTEIRVDSDLNSTVITEKGREVAITGIIDRVDVSGDYARIIDYKSSKTNLNLLEVEKGKQLQLPIYMSLIKGTYKPAGMYYSQIKTPKLSATDTYRDVLEQYKLSGVTLNNQDVLVATDRNLSENGSKSNIVNVRTTKKGSFYASSEVIEEVEMQAIMDVAMRKFLEGVDKILDGESEVNKTNDNSLFNRIDPYRSIHLANRELKEYEWDAVLDEDEVVDKDKPKSEYKARVLKLKEERKEKINGKK